MRKPSILVVFLTVFLDLIGFGIVLPLLPIYSREFGASGLVLGSIIASFSAMQFVFAPLWGRWSDRVGRRPVLLVSTLGSALSYAIFALGSGLASHTTALLVLLASRVFAGICGANITVAQAYIADVTPPAQRSKRMGLIGMAFGLGFIFGPFLGAISVKAFGITGPGWLAAALCLANFLLALVILPESRQPGSSEHAVAPRPALEQWKVTLRDPAVGLLVVAFFLATFCFACFETTLGLLIMENFRLDIEHDDQAKMTVGYLFAYCGVIGAIVQGGLIGRMVKRFGEPRLIVLSLVLSAISFVPIPFASSSEPLSWSVLVHAAGLPWLLLLTFLALLSLGTGLTRPPLFGLLSNLTPAHEQGVTIGVAQSAGSLARIVGPIFAASLFDLHPSLPYLICGVLLLLTAATAWQRFHRLGLLSGRELT